MKNLKKTTENLNIALGRNMNAASLTPLEITEIMEDLEVYLQYQLKLMRVGVGSNWMAIESSEQLNS
jgi:hypothetical protein